MKNDEPQQLKAAVTIAEMSRMCGLSRSRFYQLLNEGVFPEPMRNAETGRPYYNSEQQEICLRVRRTNCGVNGVAVLFYSHRPVQVPTIRKPRQSQSSPGDRRTNGVQMPSSDPLINQLRHGLEQLGLKEVADARIRSAIAEEYPDGHKDVDMASLLRSVFRRLKRQDSPDNVT